MPGTLVSVDGICVPAVWIIVLALVEPPDWIRVCAACVNTALAYRANLSLLISMEPICDAQDVIRTLIAEEKLIRLWYLIRRTPQVVNAPLYGSERTYPLHVAVEWGSARSVRLLLEARSSVNVVDGCGETPLHSASAFSGASVVSLLLRAMAVVNCRSHLNTMPMHLAARQGNSDVVSVLLDARAGDLDAQRRFHDSRHNGAVPILLASEGNHVEVVGLLISAGSRGVNIRKANGVSALIAAAAYGYSELLALLLSVNDEDAGAFGPAPPWNSPLLAACHCGHVESVRMIIENRASIEMPCPDGGEVPLIAAVRSDNINIVDMLLGARATNFNAFIEHNVFTPLYLACSYGNVEIVKLLLAGRALPAETWRRTPMAAAAKHGHYEVIWELASAGFYV